MDFDSRKQNVIRKKEWSSNAFIYLSLTLPSKILAFLTYTIEFEKD